MQPYCKISNEIVAEGQFIYIPIKKHFNAWCSSNNQNSSTSTCDCARPVWDVLPATMDSDGMTVSPDCNRFINFGFIALGSGPTFWNAEQFGLEEHKNDHQRELSTGFYPI
eukprot:UN08653